MRPAIRNLLLRRPAAAAALWTSPILSFPGLVMYADLSNLYTTYQTITGTTQVTADADPVGTLPDFSGGGYTMTAVANSTRRPVLGSTGRVGYLTFDGSITYLTMANSIAGLSFIPKTGIFSMGWRTRVRVNGAGGNVLFDNAAGGSTYPGIYIQRDSGNHWYLEFTKAGGQMKYMTTVGTQVVADGFVGTTVTGDGTNMYVVVGANTPEAPAAIVALEPSANAQYNLVIGGYQTNPAASFDGDLADFFVCNQYLDDSYMSAYRAYFPSTRVTLSPR